MSRPLIGATIAAGIPVNVTVVFSLDRQRAVAEAYVGGLQRLLDGGGDPSDVPSVASFFVSRVDTEIDKRLDALGGHDHTPRSRSLSHAFAADSGRQLLA